MGFLTRELPKKEKRRVCCIDYETTTKCNPHEVVKRKGDTANFTRGCFALHCCFVLHVVCSTDMYHMKRTNPFVGIHLLYILSWHCIVLLLYTSLYMINYTFNLQLVLLHPSWILRHQRLRNRKMHVDKNLFLYKNHSSFIRYFF